MKYPKKIYVAFIFMFVLGIGCSFFGMYLFQSKKEISSSIQVISSEGVFPEKKVQEIKEQYKIRAYFPYTSYEVLNRHITSFIEKNIQDFKQDINQGSIPKFQFYTLDIRYDRYAFKNYISYVFYIFLDTGGAHPNTYIHTITFDKNENKIITIDSLVQKNPRLLEILSKESFDQLQHSEKFQNEDFQNIQDMVMEGTKAISENFRNFAFSENGLIIFFENYQVAPYVYGSFQITVPYSILDLGI